MSENSINPALAHMDVAQNEVAIYALLLKRAQSSLTASRQAFERANENSITGECPTRKQITQQLRQQYKALANLTDAIVETLAAPTLSRMIKTAPKQSPYLVALFDCLPEAEKSLLSAAVICLLQAEGEGAFLDEEQAFLASSILYVASR